MSRKPKRGYFVRGQFVAEGSELDVELKREQHEGGPSKTELKSHSSELQALGEQLLGLRADLRDPLELPTRLIDALDELARIRDFEGRRRQGQYVGKLMRLLPEEQVTAIRVALDTQHTGTAADAERLHAAEQWRARLIADDGALGDWVAHHPATDVQQLRALVRQARRDATASRAPQPGAGQAPRQNRAFRELFQLLREALDPAAPNPPSTL